MALGISFPKPKVRRVLLTGSIWEKSSSPDFRFNFKKLYNFQRSKTVKMDSLANESNLSDQSTKKHKSYVDSSSKFKIKSNQLDKCQLKKFWHSYWNIRLSKKCQKKLFFWTFKLNKVMAFDSRKSGFLIPGMYPISVKAGDLIFLKIERYIGSYTFEIKNIWHLFLRFYLKEIERSPTTPKVEERCRDWREVKSLKITGI